MTALNARLPAFVAVAALLTMTAGCAQHATATGNAPASDQATNNAPTQATSSSSPVPATSSTPATSGSATSACVSHTLTITTADNNKSLCVTTGATVLVLLRGTLTAKWAVVHSSSTVLAVRPDPHFTLQVGVTGSAFEALHPGDAILSSMRYPCQGNMREAVPSAGIHCGAIAEFRVTVSVQAG